MSDSEHDASILGKRARNGPGADISEDTDMKPAAAQDDDESDDDVGPMPMPEGADNAVTKKKRKGVFVQNLHATYGPKQGPFVVVLPHERLFLDRLPSADRYYKSFMHRDVINFVVVTRCVAARVLYYTA